MLDVLVTGTAGFLHLPLPGGLFAACAFIVTLWTLVAGVLVWRAAVRSAVALADAAASA